MQNSVYMLSLKHVRGAASRQSLSRFVTATLILVICVEQSLFRIVM